ncbi:MAG: ATP-dependent helicase, partial [Acidimicrobiia bacterium]|nr:ATP-dependent helicase [Acidimicrobiia bacterium]
TAPPSPTAVDELPRWQRGLNDRQLEAATHPTGPLLIVAGAGTGKTTTLAARVSHLLDAGVRPERLLLLTFTRRAAAEMLARVGAVSGHQAAGQIWGGTFHSVANRILRRHATAVGLAPDFTVLDPADAADLVGMVRADLGLAARKTRFPRKETIAALYSRLVNAQSNLTTVLDEAYPWLRPHAEALAQVFSGYADAKRAQQVLDYDDLLLFWRALTASAELGPHLRASFDHVLVDEYQDTNRLQADIVAGMVGPAEVTVVGDDAQAIYGFRSATVENLWDFPTRFDGATTVTLEQNYRSTEPILAVANSVLAQSSTHLHKHLWTEREGGVQPRLVTAHDEAAQSNQVCDRVLELREEGFDLRDQAVLFRANHHSDHLELELGRRDIPFVKFGGLRFLEAAHVKDLMALLRILENPADQLAWHRVLSLAEGVGPATVARLGAELGLDRHADDALVRFCEGVGKVPASAAPAIDELRGAARYCTGEPEPAPADQLERLRRYCELTFPARYPDSVVRLGDLEQLQATAAGYGSRARLLVELTLDPPDRTSDRAGPPHLDDDYLVLSTIHSAKGGEWRAVHLIHASDGNLPSDMALADKDGLEEERRLLYVALTRAQQVLDVTVPLRYHTNRYGHDDDHQLAPISRFLEPVRDRFDESTNAGALDVDDVIELHGVSVADEVSASIESLWAV